MADRRSTSKKITESDAFLDMPMSAQCLYFHLNQNGDDDGFVNNPKKIARMIGASEDDLKLLIVKSFIICFESGVIVIKHWRLNNTLQNDRYHPTTYVEEFNLLGLKENNVYTLDTKCIQNVSNLDTELNLTKHNITKHNKYIGIENAELVSALTDFEAMRKKMKKPITDRAMSMLLKKLDSLADTDEKKIEIVNQSILHNWIDFYELHESKKNVENLPDYSQINQEVDLSSINDFLNERSA